VNVSILAVGQQKSGPEQALCDDYCTRFRKISRPLGITGVDQTIVKSGGGLSREGDRLLEKLPGNARLIRLDEHGDLFTSTSLAQRLAKWRDDGEPQTIFVIGGAEGYSDAVIKKCPVTYALGPQTWPHMLVRVMIAEQLYRAATILAGTPYHKA